MTPSEKKHGYKVFGIIMAMKFDKSKLVKNLAKKQYLGHLLDAEFGRFEEKFTFDYEPKGEDDAWHPSSDCTPGVVHLYEKAAGLTERKPHPPSLVKTFMVGHYWH